MNSRTRTITLAGVTLTTPLLVPSVSSRGFPVDADGISESSLLLHYAAADLPAVLLVSAYDLAHGYLDVADSFLTRAGATPLDEPELLVVDSGGYEAGQSWESGHIDRTDVPRRSWCQGRHARLIDQIGTDRPVLAVSYDGPGQPPDSCQEQVQRAVEFFEDRPHLASDLLFKPANDTLVSVDDIASTAEQLDMFDVIGVTEKELGEAVPDRLRALARLRGLLDEAGVEAPLHLFGSLDPILTPLYFAAGAEIFDGLSWLRYRFHNGVAMHPEVAAVLENRAGKSATEREVRRIVSNLQVLSDLKLAMLRLGAPHHEGFAALGAHAETLAIVYEEALDGVDNAVTIKEGS